MRVTNQTMNRILTKSKIYLFFIFFLLVSCEKEDMSTFDTIVDKYRKELPVDSSKTTVKKKRRWWKKYKSTHFKKDSLYFNTPHR
jgi:hypothetical protein